MGRGGKTGFLQKETMYMISSGYIYPIFVVFRPLLEYFKETETVNWLFDPLEVWDECCGQAFL